MDLEVEEEAVTEEAVTKEAEEAEEAATPEEEATQEEEEEEEKKEKKEYDIRSDSYNEEPIIVQVSKTKEEVVNIKNYNEIKSKYLENLSDGIFGFSRSNEKPIFKNNIHVIYFLTFLKNFDNLNKSNDPKGKDNFEKIQNFLSNDYKELLKIFNIEKNTEQSLQEGGGLFDNFFGKNNNDILNFKLKKILESNKDNSINLFTNNDVLINFLKCFDFVDKVDPNDIYKDLLYYYINFKDNKKVFIQSENLNKFMESYSNEYIEKNFLLHYISIKNNLLFNLDKKIIRKIKDLILKYIEKQNSIITNLNKIDEYITIDDENEGFLKSVNFDINKIINTKDFEDYKNKEFQNTLKDLIKQIFIKLFENHSNITPYEEGTPDKQEEEVEEVEEVKEVEEEKKDKSSSSHTIGGKKYKKTKNKKYKKNKKPTKKRKKRRLSKKNK